MKILRSFVVSFVLLLVLSMSISAVSSPTLTVDILPSTGSPGITNVSYTGNMQFQPTDNIDYYYLELTIPNGYTLNYKTPSNSIMGTFTISDIVNIRMKSATSGPGSYRSVKFEYLIPGYSEYIPIPGEMDISSNLEQSISFKTTNILKFKQPKTNDVGYVKFELGTFGPVKSGNTVTVVLNDGALINPSANTYTWTAKAKNSVGALNDSYGSDTVTIS